MKIPIHRNVAVRPARNGVGLFTKRAINAGEAIFVVTGSMVSCGVNDDIAEVVRDNTYRFDADRYISPQGRIGDFLNHSCSPNAKVMKRNGKLFVCAVGDIQKNEEVLIDYSTITASDDVWEMTCNCGSVHCRSVVRRFKTLPKTIREYYIQHAIVPSYILAM